jgi:CDP-paratose 2-epimerase
MPAAATTDAAPAFDDEGAGRTLLVTGGAGFVGSHVACAMKARHPRLAVVAFDNLRRRGSELNLPRLAAAGVRFVHGDVRQPGDLERVGAIDALVEASAEPAVLAGYGAGRGYVVQTNLVGTVHCLELALAQRADFVFLSTSRVYPLEGLRALPWVEQTSRYALKAGAPIPGVSERGIDTGFPLEGTRTLYGATKLASELLIAEYVGGFGLRAVSTRLGCISGPWQMGASEQGVAAHWLLCHQQGRPLDYIGFGGSGKQVRDFLHVDDVVDLIALQLARMDEVSGRTFNAGGGLENSLSLLEMTALCRELTGRELPVGRTHEERLGDARILVMDNTGIAAALGWRPRRPVRQIFEDLHAWAEEHAAAIAASSAGPESGS